jgi:hypothetical protein
MSEPMTAQALNEIRLAYESHADVQLLLGEVERLQALVGALANWVCEAGGWRAFYYAADPPPGVFDLSDRFNPGVAEPWPVPAAVEQEPRA